MTAIQNHEHEILLRDTFRKMGAHQAQEIREAYYKAVEGLRSLADALEIADAQNPGPASDLLMSEHLLTCTAIENSRSGCLKVLR